MWCRFVFAILLLLGLLATTPAAWTADRPVALHVDATETPRKILRARLEIPVRPGPLTLVYPRWVPGFHDPSGPVVDLAGLELSAGGEPLAWERDPLDMYAFRCEVPKGADTIAAAFDFLLPADSAGGNSPASSTANLLVLDWNQVVLYPQGRRPDDLTFTASLRLPPGWKYGTALRVAVERGGTIGFEPVSLTRLVDSPILAGRHFRRFRLTSGPGRPHFIEAAADSAAALNVDAGVVEGYRRLVAEAVALFGAQHYERYHFLLALSDHIAHYGLEHHESSDNRVRERTLIDPDRRLLEAGLLPHEIVHSWSGKYRRPAGLATIDYQQPINSELLWVYEGLTTYLGQILTARSGLWTAGQYRDHLARSAAELDNRPGRSWRPLVDTARAAQILFGAADAWESQRRGVDFYSEGMLIWLEADTLIRSATEGRRSLDDFCRSFHGGESGPPAVVPYTADDIVATLNEVAPYDWRRFLDRRLNGLDERAPLGGIEAGGWRLAYSDAKSEFLRAREEVEGITDARFSLGFLLRRDGSVRDVLPGSPAARAGVGPGMKLVAVNGRAWSREVLRDALQEGTKSADPLDLLIESGEFYRTYQVDYHGGERHPRLERIPGRDDLLGEILAPLVARVAE